MTENTSKNKKFNLRIIGKAAIIGALLLLMLIPLYFIKERMYERKDYKSHALETISSSWGSDQLIAAPFLNLSYTYETVETVGKEKKITSRISYRKLSPQNLDVTVTMLPQMRYIGIFEMPVYTAQVNLKGSFAPFSERDGYKDAILTVELKDLKGIIKAPQGKFGGKDMAFEPYSGSNTVKLKGSLGPSEDDPVAKKRSRYTYDYDYDYDSKSNGINAIASKVRYDKNNTEFEISFPLQGSGTINFVPTAKQNKFIVKSDWKDPLFYGNFLPVQKEVSSNGFEAQWDISYLASGVPQYFESMEVSDSVFGVKLSTPVDNYRNGLRAAKHGLLFLALTFLACFVFEIVGKQPIHPFQYVMVGVAMSLFYLLLVSFSEFISFGLAYFISSAAVIAMITLYIRYGVIKMPGLKYSLIPAGILTGLYIYLYILLQLQDFSMLFGALGLFIGLATVMYTTRNINWYE